MHTEHKKFTKNYQKKKKKQFKVNYHFSLSVSIMLCTQQKIQTKKKTEK